VKLADAQLAIARSYHAPSWTRLAQAIRTFERRSAQDSKKDTEADRFTKTAT